MAANNQTVTESEPVTEPAGTAVDDDEQPEQRATDGESGSGDDVEASLPLDQVFEILKNERRRTVLRYLAEHEEPVALGDLAEFVAADENDTSVKQISSRERKCAYVGLYQCHLPKMDNMDIIEFNQNRGLVETGPNAPQLEQYMEWSGSPARPWPLYYGSAAGVGLLGLLTTALLGGASTVTVALCLTVLLGVAAISVAHHFADE